MSKTSRAGAASPRQYKLLSHEEELALATAWLERRDAKARDKIILLYRPLATSIATRLARQCGMQSEDLVQEALLALAESLDKFVPSMGNRFGTFARWHIGGQVRRYVMDNFGPCRIGTNFSDKKVFSRFRRLRSEIEARTGRPLDDDGRQEIAEEIGVSYAVVQRMEPRIMRADVSLDAPLATGGDDDQSTTRLDLLVDDAPSPEMDTMTRLDHSRVMGLVSELIQELPEREQTILHHRLFADDRIQLSELGERLGVTKERVRQLERKALRQLQRSLEDLGFHARDLIHAA